MNNMPTFFQNTSRRTGGFSLVEILVGMTIGMLGILVIFQVFSLFEGQNRTTSGSGDAQTNGTIAAYWMERDIRQGGYGISSINLLGCNVLLRTGVTLAATAPVTINHASIPAGDANTDTVLVVYGNSSSSTEGDGITQQPTATVYAVMTPTAFTAGDRVIAEPSTRPAPCSLTLDQVSGAPAGSNVTVTTGQAGVANGTLYNLGQTPKVLAYAIRGGNLTVCDYMANDCGSAGGTGNSSVWVPISSNIVSLRAQYGRDTSGPPMDAIVDAYDQTTPTTACGWARASAVRIGLLARNGQYDKDNVTTSAPTWAGGSFTLSADADWQHYRYKVFQTVVPIRNVTWMGVQTGC